MIALLGVSLDCWGIASDSTARHKLPGVAPPRATTCQNASHGVAYTKFSACGHGLHLADPGIVGGNFRHRNC